MRKTCTKCRTEKSDADFMKDSSRADGLYPHCRPCRKVERAAYHEKNREKVIARVDAWRKKNAETLRPKWVEYRHRRMDAERKTGGSFTTGDVSRILNLQGYKCPNCRTDLKNGYHVDHIQPVSLGGSSNPDNLQMLCPSCNMRKSYKDPIEWANNNGRLL